MKKIFALILTLALITCMLTSTALASTKAQLLTLKNHLSETLPSENIFDDDTYQFSGFFTFSTWAIDEDDGEYVGVTIGSNVLDSMVLDYINQTDDASVSQSTVMTVLMNLSGKAAKQAKICGVTDTNIIILYETSKSTVGAELQYGIIINVDEDYVNVVADEIFGATGAISLSKNFDNNYCLDMSTFSN